eukprot:TRINITY_DN123870_c0_g1_i1.p1 TRINITY_DN123870_c0_g1~~TRINITY_DN123870_c0_g1_i1.p1  ORF type:complete len:258 (+),score=46.41 TRINITY_DN123870_c0_g1_i1:172-945(+)
MQGLDVAVTIRKIATDCIKTVRSATESEEEAVELVLSIWNATVAHAAHSLRVGKALSLMPLGVLYQMHNPDPGDGNEHIAQLAVSELFVMQYGIASKPTDPQHGPGPSTKPAYAEIATAVRVSDKQIIPNVLAALMHRIGEMCSTHPRVVVDCAPLGEIICEFQKMEFVPAQPATKTRGFSVNSESKRTVRSMLERRRKELVDSDIVSEPGSLSARGHPHQSPSPMDDPLPSVRSVDANSLVFSMVGRRVDMSSVLA